MAPLHGSPPEALPGPEPPSAIRETVTRDAENRPGIYRFIGPRGEVLYIGKSVRVRSRLLSWLRERKGKAVEILRVARGVEWEYTPTEFEALLREFRLIRAFRPRFNVRHRRDRRFAWVRITDEPAPRILATRRPTTDGARHFGPFPASRRLPEAIRDLAHLLGIRDCPARTPMHFSDQLDLLDPPRTPACARAELGSCPAPCAALVSRAAYQEGIAEATAFLEGRTDAPLERMRARIETAARTHRFESAARWRDRRERIGEMRDAILEYRRYLDSLHFLYRVPLPEGGTRCYRIVRGRVVERWDGDGPASSGAGDPLPPLDEEAREELFLVARWFRDHPEELERTTPLMDDAMEGKTHGVNATAGSSAVAGSSM